MNRKTRKTSQPRKKSPGFAPQLPVQTSRHNIAELKGLSCEGVTKVDDILVAVVELMDVFYWTFHLEWAETKRRIANADEQVSEKNWFGKEGTFVKPTIADAREDWFSRDRLLSAYSKLLGILHGLEERAEQANEFSDHLHCIAFDPMPPLVSED